MQRANSVRNSESLPHGEGHWGGIISRHSSAGKVNKNLNLLKLKKALKYKEQYVFRDVGSC